MSSVTIELPEVLTRPITLPDSLPVDGAISLELQEGIPILRASLAVQQWIEQLVHKQHEGILSEQEQHDLDSYEEIDDYLSLLNRLTRNLYIKAGNN
jgi:hypothetical protein